MIKIIIALIIVAIIIFFIDRKLGNNKGDPFRDQHRD